MEMLYGASVTTRLSGAELNRLARWLEERDVTAIVTGERGEKTSPGTGSRSTSPTA